MGRFTVETEARWLVVHRSSEGAQRSQAAPALGDHGLGSSRRNGAASGAGAYSVVVIDPS